MKIVTGLTAGMLILAVSDAGFAAVPQLSGRYIFNVVRNCEIVVSTPKIKGAVNSVKVINSGSFDYNIGYATFSGNNFTFTGTNIGGDLFVNESWSHGNPITRSSTTFSGTFSNNGSALTLTPTGSSSITETIFYGAVASGIAQQFMLAGFTTKTSDGTPERCAHTGTAIRAGD